MTRKILKWPVLLFDFDGTLVSTEELAQEAILGYFRDSHFPHAEELAKKIVGRTWKSAAQLIYQDLSQQGVVTNPPEVMIHEWKVRYRAEFKTGVKLIPGIMKKLNALKDLGALMGIVTGSDYDEAHSIMEQHHLTPFFKDIWAAGDYEHSKPHPSPYLKAMSDLKVDRAHVMVFEDSTVGVESAFQAGVPWIQVLHGSYTVPDPRSYKQIKDWDKLELDWLMG